MTITSITSQDYGPDVHSIQFEDKHLLLIGTAHISQESVDLVQRVIDTERPDCVCLELDDKRYQAMSRQESWQSLDLKQIIRNKQLSTLMVSLVMGSYQKKLGGQLGVKPGAEMLIAASTAKEHNIAISLCDRDVSITLRRAWKATSLFRKGYLLTTLLASLFDSEQISEEKLADMKKKDVLSSLMEEMGQSFPELKRVLIDERDIYLSEKIKNSQGKRLVAVVGAGHVAGIIKSLTTDQSHKMQGISEVPPASPYWKIVGWSIPALILASLVAIGYLKGANVAGANVVFWILANGIPAAVGALLALAHPFTTIGAFTAAPITSLTPVIGAGYVTAFIQVMTRPPVVREFESVGEDISSFTGWWKNKLLRVFLVFFFTGLGSAIGTWVGGYEIFKNLFS
jgi:pheromone shutdown-related protein TraB